ncbi:DUF2187 family protein [Ornithinibacillus bavariensis]|uniref:DUF2187 domain-containing protein n=1 Tax=Ornithinibacillus bavariensis TaxID=545502 RepID=A0A919XCA4_9BACI|nr:DUF2187 family protein [Ornithinibacillus bavariensis]GIO27933.1 hypothetical protein J43TS3_25440 [Ornithinibacillus bavariensis]HAM80291.1 DUF2187 domain-containing protein [Ornithinibacillus sp.]
MTNSTQANVEDTIEIVNGEHKGKKGKVLIVRENSVIVEIGHNKVRDEPIKTVVNHKNYKVVK